MDYLKHLTERYPELTKIEQDITQTYQALVECFETGGKLLVCGNGGSAADSDHIVGELMKGFYKQRKLPEQEKDKYRDIGNKLQGALPAIALTQHPALLTAYLNDVDPEMVFAQQVYGYGNQGDVFLGLSTSGNSRNVIAAAKVAAAKKMKVVCMTGRDGGNLKKISDISVVVPAEVTADIQEYHLPIYHALCAMVEEHFFAS